MHIHTCLCQETGSCGRQDKCFRGAGSSTLRPPRTDGTGEVSEAYKRGRIKKQQI